ncbi:unnamed protein product [Haemonchus placei]|uniref:Reverse transcriptase n=1 Tax=Haemonchus placei TaxID=6290 RepID=A0A0N4VSM8_HAEPC|nr:unnamed protein product [Haemonchus placei]
MYTFGDEIYRGIRDSVQHLCTHSKVISCRIAIKGIVLSRLISELFLDIVLSYLGFKVYSVLVGKFVVKWDTAVVEVVCDNIIGSMFLTDRHLNRTEMYLLNVIHTCSRFKRSE